MVFIGMGYACGLFFASFFKIYISLIISAVIIISAIYSLKAGKVRQLSLFCASFFVGALVLTGYNRLVYDKIAAYDGRDISFCGSIISARSYSADMALYTADGRSSDGTEMKLVFYTADVGGGYGDEISVCGTAHLIENTSTFAAADYYRGDGIYLELEQPADISVLRRGSPVKSILEYRDIIIGRFKSVLSGDEGDALCAMLFGEKTGLDSDAKKLMYRCGIGHVMSASGLHLVICAGAVQWLLRFFTRNRRIQAVAVIAAAGLFTLFAGMSMSVCRAFIMLVIMYSARFFFREQDCLNSLSVALLVLLLFQPYAVTDCSLLLSAVGTFGIGVAAPWLTMHVASERIKPLLVMVCVSLCVFPVSLLFFSEVSLISPLMNVLLIPVCTVALLLGFIAALLPFETYLLTSAAGVLCRFVLYVCKAVGSADFVYLPVGEDFLYYAVFGLAAVIFAVWLVMRSRKAVARTSVCAVCVISLLFSWNTYSRRNIVSVAWLGSARGYTAVLSRGKTAVVIDMSAGATSDEAVSAYLSRRGINSAALIVSGKSSASRIPAYYDEMELFSPVKAYAITDLKSLPCDILDSSSEIVFCDCKISLNDGLKISCGGRELTMLGDSLVQTPDGGIYLTSDSFEADFV